LVSLFENKNISNQLLHNATGIDKIDKDILTHEIGMIFKEYLKNNISESVWPKNKTAGSEMR
jgi:hypothetical protein